MEKTIVFMRAIKLVYMKHGLRSPTLRYRAQRVVSFLRLEVPEVYSPRFGPRGDGRWDNISAPTLLLSSQ